MYFGYFLLFLLVKSVFNDVHVKKNQQAQTRAHL